MVGAYAAPKSSISGAHHGKGPPIRTAMQKFVWGCPARGGVPREGAQAAFAVTNRIRDSLPLPRWNAAGNCHSTPGRAGGAMTMHKFV